MVQKTKLQTTVYYLALSPLVGLRQLRLLQLRKALATQVQRKSARRTGNSAQAQVQVLAQQRASARHSMRYSQRTTRSRKRPQSTRYPKRIVVDRKSTRLNSSHLG